METTNPSTLGVARMIGLLLWFAYCFCHQGTNSPTSLSRLDALHAVYKQQNFQIDAYHNNTPDKAFHGGHYYSDKAPGILFLALPAFFCAATLITYFEIDLDSNPGWVITSWITTASSVALVAAFGGAAFFIWLSRRVPSRVALITTLAIFLGAAPFPYSTMLLSHSAVIGFLAITLWAVDDQKKQITEWRITAAGLSLGLALASEYTAGLVILCLIGYIVHIHGKRTLRVALWMLLPLALIPIYSHICFQTVSTIGYSHHSSFYHHTQGYFGITYPDISTMHRLLFGSQRGLFFWSPFVALAIIGIIALASENDLTMFWLSYIAFTLQVCIISGYIDWLAGPGIGPRLLSPVLPIIGLPIALAIWRFPYVGILSAAASLIITGGATLVNGSPDIDSINPFLDVHCLMLKQGSIAANLLTLFGANPVFSVLMFFACVFLFAYQLWWRLSPSELYKSPIGDSAAL